MHLTFPARGHYVPEAYPNTDSVLLSTAVVYTRVQETFVYAAGKQVETVGVAE